MQFLGKLGIDWKLLLAQIINFGLLLWLLSKFLYKPIIKQIEKDEAELKQVQTQKKELEREKYALRKQQEKTIAEAKRRSQEIIKEAEDVAGGVKKQINEEAKKEAKAIILQTKKIIQSQKQTVKKETLKGLKTKISKNFQLSFEKITSPSLQKELQNLLFLDLRSKISALSLKKLKESDLVDILEKLDLVTKKRGSKKEKYEKELEESLTQKIGLVVLEYVFPLTRKQQEKLEKIISEKIGLKTKIRKKQNKNLINGFRFEIMGSIIESNLLNVIENAASFEEQEK